MGIRPQFADPRPAAGGGEIEARTDHRPALDDAAPENVINYAHKRVALVCAPSR